MSEHKYGKISTPLSSLYCVVLILISSFFFSSRHSIFFRSRPPQSFTKPPFHSLPLPNGESVLYRVCTVMFWPHWNYEPLRFDSNHRIILSQPFHPFSFSPLEVSGCPYFELLAIASGKTLTPSKTASTLQPYTKHTVALV